MKAEYHLDFNYVDLRSYSVRIMMVDMRVWDGFKKNIFVNILSYTIKKTARAELVHYTSVCEHWSYSTAL